MQISYIKKSEIVKASRFDAETFKPEYIEVEKKLKKINSVYLNKIVGKYTNGAEVRNFEKKGIPYIRVSNTSNEFFVNFNDVKYISEKDFNNHNTKFFLSKNDLLLNRSGTLGFCQIVNFENTLFSSHNIRLSNIKVNPYFLCTFLNSYYGKNQIFRYSSGALVPEINHLGLNLIQIPLLPETFQLEIEQLVKTAKEKQNKAKQNYQQAEQILLQELGLINFVIEHQLAFTIRKKQVDSVKRFDAEYFQPKYDKIIKHIENYKGGFCEIKKLVHYKKGFEVGSGDYLKEGFNFGRVSDFSIHGFEKVEKKISKETFTELKALFQPKIGEILFTKDGTIGISYLLKEDFTGILSSAFLRLETKSNFNKETLTLILNSICTKLQVEKLSGGALINHLKPTDFEKIKIPLISQNIQKEIAELISESHHLRRESKALLETAKQKVETKIESLAS